MIARPVDQVPKPKDWAMSRSAAICGGRCAICGGRCACCGGRAVTFDDDTSAREYHISGLCQRCQDRFYEAMSLMEEDSDE